MASVPSSVDVMDHLGRGDVGALAGVHLPLVVAFVREYTRGAGFENYDNNEVPEGIRAVIIAATARLVTNPAQVGRESADGYESVGSFNGFSLPELAVLHRYRQRTA